MFWITSLATLVTLVALFAKYPTGGERVLGASIFLVAAIMLVYLMAKTGLAHKAAHHLATGFDTILEYLALPVAMLALVTRKTALSYPSLFEEPLVWVAVFLLADPLKFVGAYLRELDAVRSDRLLKGIVRDNPQASSDYLPAMAAFCVAYVALWA